MITLNDTPTTDSALVWIIEIIDDDKTYYLASEDITLSGQAYDGEIFLQDSFSALSKDVNISDGGSIGSVGNFSFKIADKADSTDFNDLFDDFYPNNTTYLTGREVKIGLLWDTATTQAEITWIGSQRIENINWDVSYNIDCVDFPEYEGKDLPPYEVQSSYDNAISYYVNALKEAYGTPIPIVYGSFPQATVANIRQFDFSLTPVVPVDKLQLKFLVACHKCDSFAVSQLYKYYEDAESYFQLKGKKRLGAGSYSNIEAVSNNSGGCEATILNEGGFVDGHGYLHPTINKGDFTHGGTTYTPDEQTNNIFDRDLDTSVTLSPGDIIHVGFDSEEISGELADTYVRNSILALKIKTQAVGGNQQFTIRITDPLDLTEAQLDAGGLNFIKLSGSPSKNYKTETATTSETLWDIDGIIDDSGQPVKDLMAFGLFIKNESGGANTNDLKIFEIYWEISSPNRSIVIHNIIKKRKRRLKTWVRPDMHNRSWTYGHWGNV